MTQPQWNSQLMPASMPKQNFSETSFTCQNPTKIQYHTHVNGVSVVNETEGSFSKPRHEKTPAISESNCILSENLNAPDGENVKFAYRTELSSASPLDSFAPHGAYSPYAKTVNNDLHLLPYSAPQAQYGLPNDVANMFMDPTKPEAERFPEMPPLLEKPNRIDRLKNRASKPKKISAKAGSRKPVLYSRRNRILQEKIFKMKLSKQRLTTKLINVAKRFARPIKRDIPKPTGIASRKVEEKPKFSLEEMLAMGDEEYGAARHQLDGFNLPHPSPPVCDCSEGQECGPFYAQLGHSSSVEDIRNQFETRLSLSGDQLRIEQLVWKQVRSDNHYGCPIAKEVLQSGGEEVLITVKNRPNHKCQYSWIVVSITVWKGIPREVSDGLYDYLKDSCHKVGRSVLRQSGLNDTKSCMCQGSGETEAMSMTVGCSYSMFSNTCKFARTLHPEKMKILDPSKKEEIHHLGSTMTAAAVITSRVFEKIAPIAFRNMTFMDSEENFCRLGEFSEGPRPFAAATACVDFCTHSHRDRGNMHGGATVVVSLLKNSGIDPADEQLHTLPFYGLAGCDSETNQRPGIEILNRFPTATKVRRFRAANSKELQAEHDRKLFSRRKRNLCASVPLNVTPESDCHIPKTEEIFHSEPKKSASSLPSFMHVMESKSGHMINPPEKSVSHLNPDAMADYTDGPRMHLENFVPESDFNYAADVSKELLARQYCVRNLFGTISHPNESVFPEKESLIPCEGIAQVSNPDTQRPSSPVNKSETVDEFQTPEWKRAENDVEFQIDDSANEDILALPHVGGVAFRLPHGSVHIEVAKMETHATTALKHPNSRDPTRISLVFYQHHTLSYKHHGHDEMIAFRAKSAEAKRLKEERARKLAESSKGNEDQEAMANNLSFVKQAPLSPKYGETNGLVSSDSTTMKQHFSSGKPDPVPANHAFSSVKQSSGLPKSGEEIIIPPCSPSSSNSTTMDPDLSTGKQGLMLSECCEKVVVPPCGSGSFTSQDRNHGFPPCKQDTFSGTMDHNVHALKRDPVPPKICENIVVPSCGSGSFNSKDKSHHISTGKRDTHSATTVHSAHAAKRDSMPPKSGTSTVVPPRGFGNFTSTDRNHYFPPGKHDTFSATMEHIVHAAKRDPVPPKIGQNIVVPPCGSGSFNSKDRSFHCSTGEQGLLSAMIVHAANRNPMPPKIGERIVVPPCSSGNNSKYWSRNFSSGKQDSFSATMNHNFHAMKRDPMPPRSGEHVVVPPCGFGNVKPNMMNHNLSAGKRCAVQSTTYQNNFFVKQDRLLSETCEKVVPPCFNRETWKPRDSALDEDQFRTTTDRNVHVVKRDFLPLRSGDDVVVPPLNPVGVHHTAMSHNFSTFKRSSTPPKSGENIVVPRGCSTSERGPNNPKFADNFKLPSCISVQPAPRSRNFSAKKRLEVPKRFDNNIHAMNQGSSHPECAENVVAAPGDSHSFSRDRMTLSFSPGEFDRIPATMNHDSSASNQDSVLLKRGKTSLVAHPGSGDFSRSMTNQNFYPGKQEPVPWKCSENVLVIPCSSDNSNAASMNHTLSTVKRDPVSPRCHDNFAAKPCNSGKIYHDVSTLTEEAVFPESKEDVAMPSSSGIFNAANVGHSSNSMKQEIRGSIVITPSFSGDNHFYSSEIDDFPIVNQSYVPVVCGENYARTPNSSELEDAPKIYHNLSNAKQGVLSVIECVENDVRAPCSSGGNQSYSLPTNHYFSRVLQDPVTLESIDCFQATPCGLIGTE
ncbi:unnamed protein product [Notodromas monacha]|uniref:Methylcytosine dioxygenase TET n=1 Tax=Notodromas monacha TaxID=399045 RepID=A0A7R9BGS7_9CRUS|nr:unnamed protein product [Notodromas monacha]CAG0913831.1 unnamed protein product [Notodromas monacha]